MKAREISDMERLDRMEGMISTLQKNMEQLIIIANHSQQQQQKLAKEVVNLSTSNSRQTEMLHNNVSNKPEALHITSHRQPDALHNTAQVLPNNSETSSGVVNSSVPQATKQKSFQKSSTAHALIDDDSQKAPSKPPILASKRRPLPHQRASVQGTSDTFPQTRLTSSLDKPDKEGDKVTSDNPRMANRNSCDIAHLTSDQVPRNNSCERQEKATNDDNGIPPSSKEETSNQSTLKNDKYETT